MGKHLLTVVGITTLIVGGFVYTSLTETPVIGENLGGAVLLRELKPNEKNNIKTKMDSLKVTNGEYTQKTLDGRLLISNGEIVDQQLTDLLPANMIIDVYTSPTGSGFELVQDLADRIVHYGFGVEATERTYTILKPVQGIATST